MSHIIQAKWHARLETWARWLVSGRAGGKGKSSLLDYGSTPYWSDAFSPQPPIGESTDTDDLLQKMATGDEIDRNRYEAVKAWYTWLGTAREWARTLNVHPDTLRDRVIAAYYRLEELDLLRRRSAVKPAKQVAQISTS